MKLINNDQFQENVVSLRKRVIELSQVSIQVNLVNQIVKLFSNIRQDIANYIEVVQNQVQKLSKNRLIKQQQSLPPHPSNRKYQSEKNMLYLWQIINFISIYSGTVNQESTVLITKMLRFTVQYYFFNSNNTIKNSFIAIHNLIVKIIDTQELYLKYEQTIFQWLQIILVYGFQPTNSSLQQYFNYEKIEENLLGETEWMAYILKIISANNYYQSHSLSLIGQMQRLSNRKKLGYYLLHMIGNYFQDMIDKRVTTELIRGFECGIQDIKQMYAAKDKCLIQLKIGREDLRWICRNFKLHMESYIKLIADYTKKQIEGCKEFQMEQFVCEWQNTTDHIEESIHVLNCVLFIGGYNNKLQDQIIVDLLEKDTTLLQYFQISYLLYRNIEATKSKTKISLVVQMEKETKKKLFNLVGIEGLDISQLEIKAMSLEKVLSKGQMVSLIRLLANLVHINQNAQKPFQNSPKYLHMILSLTHDNVSQVTMKEWAIMFIRNVSESSAKLREEIGSIKMEMKVE